MQEGYWQVAAYCVFSASNQLTTYARYRKPYSQSAGLVRYGLFMQGLLARCDVLCILDKDKLCHIDRDLGEFVTLYSCKGFIDKLRRIVVTDPASMTDMHL